MSFRLGLTGSIGMGKSTTARMFAAEGCAVWDADEAVHRLYSVGGRAYERMKKLFPEAVFDHGIDRAKLRRIVAEKPDSLSKIEAIVHPLVRQDRATFKESTDADVIVFDIPLLFETGAEAEFDAIVCVFVDDQTQEQRVLSRATMTREQFEQICAKQMPTEEKLKKSDYAIETDTLVHTRMQVQNILRQIRGEIQNA